MNLSGQAVTKLVGYFRPEFEHLLIVLDDLALPVGRVRARRGGSAGGHKGLADILRTLGTPRISRLRVGIGPLPDSTSSIRFVLSAFEPAEEAIIQQSVESAANAVEDWIFNGIEYVMDKYNGRNVTGPHRASTQKAEQDT